MKSLLALALALASTPALADEEAAEVCLRAKVWEGYESNWAIRTMTSVTLAPKQTSSYLVTLYAGNEYRFLACGDEDARDLDVLLYDMKGEVIVRDETNDREPVVTYKPEQTGSYYVVLYAQGFEPSKPTAAAALAITYR